jgi:hypothetical protein
VNSPGPRHPVQRALDRPMRLYIRHYRREIVVRRGRWALMTGAAW